VAVGWQALIVASLAGFVGLAELLSRYRSDPKYVLGRPLAWVYILINALAGLGALLLIRALGWRFGQTQHVDLWRVLVAGFGAIAFFRSSLFVTKIGGTVVGVGPSLVLGAVLDACDRAIDRKSAERLSEMMKPELSKGLDPDKVMAALPVLCLALMQNFPSGDQAQLGADLSNIRNDKTIALDTRMQAVVIQLAKHLGDEVVRHVLKNGREVFVAGQPPAQAVIEQAKKELSESEPEAPAGGTTS
jgi:hypothetical protein